MSINESDKRQNFFKAITSEKDREELIAAIVRARVLLQIKQEGIKTTGPQDLTCIKTATRDERGVIGVFQNGPTLSKSEVTVAFDLAKAMFFCTAALSEVYGDKYVLKFKKIFELQRRDAFRVTIPPNLISARILIETVNDKAVNHDFRIYDLSAGGMGLAADDVTAALVPNAAGFTGSVRVGNHAAVGIQAIVKYHRKVSTDKAPYIHVGCEFKDITAALSQKIAFLVNDCHRISFARLSK